MARKPPLSFLYQTRTILRSTNGSNTSHLLRQHLSTHPHLYSENHPPSRPKSSGDTNRHSRHREPARRNAQTPLTGEDHSETPISPRPNLVARSTITPAERRAFDAILSSPQNQKSSSPPITNKKSSPPPSLDTDVNRILDIFSNSVKTAHVGRHPSPPSAADAFLQSSELPSHVIEQLGRILNHTNPPDDLRDAVFQRLYQIVNALDHASNSVERRPDIALWDACEQHVFSLASSLNSPCKPANIYSPPELASSTHQGSRSPSDLEQNGISPKPQSHPPVLKEPGPIPQQELDILSPVREAPDDVSVLRHVYPAVLLYALHLFTDKFPSSHLAFNLLPRIRQLGHTSYVLGATPQFYNSLMDFQWRAHSSLRQIDSLLSEMDQSGVELDHETCQVLRRIEMDRARDMGQGRNLAAATGHSRGADWWNKHEQIAWYPKILSWLQLVTKRSKQNRTPEVLTTDTFDQSQSSEIESLQSFASEGLGPSRHDA